MTTLLFLSEVNYNAANDIISEGYSQMLTEQFGINCNKSKNYNKSYLEYKYRLDESICIK